MYKHSVTYDPLGLGLLLYAALHCLPCAARDRNLVRRAGKLNTPAPSTQASCEPCGRVGECQEYMAYSIAVPSTHVYCSHNV